MRVEKDPQGKSPVHKGADGSVPVYDLRGVRRQRRSSGGLHIVQASRGVPRPRRSARPPKRSPR